MKKQIYESTKIERAGFLSYFIGQNALFYIVTFLAALYYTTVLGIPLPISASIFLVARIWDGINDPLLSVLVEKARLKGGKFIPWLRGITFVLPIATVLAFGFTDALVSSTLTIRVIYATVTYIFWGMAYTISDVPGYAVATVMSHNQHEKNTLLSLSRMVALIGLLISAFGVQSIIESTGSWTIGALVLGIFSFVLMLGIFFVKERVTYERKSVSFKSIIKSVVQNKYTVYVFITVALLSITNFQLVIYPFMAVDYYQDPGLTPIILSAFLIPIILSASFTPMLVRKFGKRNIFLFSIASTIVLSILMYFVGPDNFSIFIGLQYLKSLLGGFWFVVITLLYADSIEYGYYKNGERYEAATFAAQTFSAKTTAAISAALAMLLLSFYGYQESIVGVDIIQTEATLNGMWLLFNIAPVVGAIAAFVFFWKKYDLTEEKLEDMKKTFESKSTN